MSIPQSFIQELIARADVVEIVGRYVQLKKGGANYMGLCPFHAEKSPSFTVSPTKQFFHCFGCGKNGNAIGFLMEHAGMNFVEAVKDLAHTYGLFAHVGMPVMMQSLRGYGSTMVEAAARIDRSYIATENANHRTDHAVVGALVARVWQLAPEVMVAIRRHHDLDMLGDADTEPEAHTLVAAGLVAEHLMRRHEGLPPDADWAGHEVAALDWLHLAPGDLAQWEEELMPLLDAC